MCVSCDQACPSTGEWAILLASRRVRPMAGRGQPVRPPGPIYVSAGRPCSASLSAAPILPVEPQRRFAEGEAIEVPCHRVPEGVELLGDAGFQRAFDIVLMRAHHQPGVARSAPGMVRVDLRRVQCAGFYRQGTLLPQCRRSFDAYHVGSAASGHAVFQEGAKVATLPLT